MAVLSQILQADSIIAQNVLCFTL